MAVYRGMNAIPMIIPSLGFAIDMAAILDHVDGLFITGSQSNIEPHHYNEPVLCDKEVRDAKRDATTMPLIRAAIARGIPVLTICRGTQELNVAMGGSLHQRVHELPGGFDHREKQNVPLEDKIAAAHTVRLSQDGYLARISPCGNEFFVNSLHEQAVYRLGSGVVVEAVAPDGIIEAIRVADAPSFAVGVQWHPEWWPDDPFTKALFAEFGKATRHYRANKNKAVIKSKKDIISRTTRSTHPVSFTYS